MFEFLKNLFRDEDESLVARKMIEKDLSLIHENLTVPWGTYTRLAKKHGVTPGYVQHIASSLGMTVDRPDWHGKNE